MLDKKLNPMSLHDTCNMWGHMGPLWTIMGHYGPLWIIMDYRLYCFNTRTLFQLIRWLDCSDACITVFVSAVPSVN